MAVIGSCLVKDIVWDTVVHSRAGSSIKKICGHSKGFGPVGGWHVCVDEEGAANIVQSAKDAFSLAVLRRSVWA